MSAHPRATPFTDIQTETLPASAFERPASAWHGRIIGFPGDQSMSAATLPNAASHSFRLSEEQEQLRREIRAFAAKEIAPHVMEWDEASEFPAGVVKQLGHMGLLGMLIPSELGGAELGYVDYMMAIGEISAVDGSI